MSAALPTTPYQVKLEVFSGPLDLLLYLVRKDEVEIFDLSLERLTKQYIDFLAAQEVLDLDHASDFIATAAYLLYLKSRRLLPVEVQPNQEDGEEDNEDPRWELIRQLLEYKKFKEAAGYLKDQEMQRYDLFSRPEEAAQTEHLQAVAATPVDPGRALKDLTTLDIIAAFQRVLQKLEKRNDAQQIYQERFSVAEKMEELLERIAAPTAGGRLRFFALFESVEFASRLEITVTFLALLELVRLKHLRVVQEVVGGEIEILGAS